MEAFLLAILTATAAGSVSWKWRDQPEKDETLKKEGWVGK
jgi:hypothetical protein